MKDVEKVIDMNQEILLDKILPECKEHPSLYNAVSNIIYKTYGKPMGAGLSLVISYIIIQLEKEGKINVRII